jgi:hypothetical protein
MKTVNHLFKTLVVLLITTLSLSNINAQQLAFPGAEGHGRYTTGGRGGTVYVIIRYLRFRLGSKHMNEDDAFGGRNEANIIIDHCSMSWSIDECASFYDNENFTMQWCILAESLWASGHPKGNHGYGGIWGGMKASFHHNLLSSHTSRNPRFCGARYHLATQETEIVDFRNNVIFNWGFNSTYGGESGHQNMVNNYYKAGPATESSKKDRIVDINQLESDPLATPGEWYITGNYVDGFPAITADNWAGGVQGNWWRSCFRRKCRSY